MMENLQAMKSNKRPLASHRLPLSAFSERKMSVYYRIYSKFFYDWFEEDKKQNELNDDGN